MSQYLRRFVFIAFASALLPYALIPAASAQTVAPDISRGAPQDWSHKHLIYANPDTREEAARKGTLAFEEWKQKYKDPRFAQQVARKQRFVQPSQGSGFSAKQLQWFQRFDRNPPAASPEIHRDWSNVMGGATGVGRAGVFPAKFSFDINATPDCANDFVVYTTASAGATSSGAFATRKGTFTSAPAAGGTVTITHAGSPPLVLTASTTSNLGLNFQIGGTTAATATNLANAIARNGGTAGVTATSATNVVTVTSLTSGTTPNVALAETMTRFSWAGGGLTGGSGTAGQPTIVAFNQLYKGTTSPACGTTVTQEVPATFWSYNTGTNAFAETSPVLSLDGKQVAFVQRTGTVASLVLLKWSSTVSVGTVGAPTAPTTVTPAAYPGCTAPCMTVMTFTGSPNNTNSSPYYVYFDDVLYVGADNGTLHKFTGVFSGTPGEVTGGGWPVTVSTGNMLSSPVYDSDSGLVFVGSDSGASTGGRLHSVNASSGAVQDSIQLAAYTINTGGANTTGVRDAPLVDSTAQRVYAFVESGVLTQASCGTNIECKVIYQFQTNVSLASQTTPVKATLGRGQIAARVLYAGVLDNGYYNSVDSTSPSGNLYACGSYGDNTTSTQPTLWKIPIVNNVMQAPIVGPLLVSASGVNYCSPITEIYNGAQDRLYVSVSANGINAAGGCSGTAGCIFMFDVTSANWGSAVTPGAGLAAAGGTSGIVVDNISSAITGASQIYYSTLTSPGNAVQASQAGLQ